ncbi:hypothetical protein TIFTF001_035058 [Ficus carica]|uniref:Uncharacterized protein n=1 Tax=Ficus carica TaxID=3494 RepID=A0AA88E2H8_FICCA|nr:hypothetical protein TIFTF001_035035 [Ficus carica]GMN65993.1 hypothetical protein TIFTF001_035058 [Ficus carica]
MSGRRFYTLRPTASIVGPKVTHGSAYYSIKISSDLSVILTQNKLTGENFNDRKRNLLIVLNFEKHSFVLTQPRPPTPTIDAPDRDDVALEYWDNSNLSAMCYIRASMSNVLQKQDEEHQTARQKVGTPIKEHMMKVMAYLSEAQTNGAEIDSATQLVMSYKPLRTFLRVLDLRLR